jgi:HEAT repeat protein
MTPDETWTPDALLDAAAGTSADADAYWRAVELLQRKDPETVWALVAPLADDPDPRRRALVPDVLRFLGGRPQPLLRRTVDLLRRMARPDEAPNVLTGIGTAFVDIDDPAAIEIMLPFARHAAPGVRESVVHAIMRHGGAEVVDALVALSADADVSVRDWATFALANLVREPGVEAFFDSETLREALVARLTDANEETRAEAALGLAVRGDARALPVVRAALEARPRFTHYIHAAEALAAPELCAPLRHLAATANDEEREAWEFAGLAEAIEACAANAHHD